MDWAKGLSRSDQDGRCRLVLRSSFRLDSGEGVDKAQKIELSRFELGVERAIVWSALEIVFRVLLVSGSAMLGWLGFGP